MRAPRTGCGTGLPQPVHGQTATGSPRREIPARGTVSRPVPRPVPRPVANPLSDPVSAPSPAGGGGASSGGTLWAAYAGSV
ncbi:hypothetical protein [Actinomadura nitritigenes]|uniref:hypothetical protein n=1 Tax=Actinomadura nitritigenes TaxID=134602 RepID=UPI0031D0CCDD